MNWPAPVDDLATIHRMLDQAEALFLDFDGPICNIFAEVSAGYVAERLRRALVSFDAANLPDRITKTNDPFDVLRYAATVSLEQADKIETIFASHETDAVESATPTPNAHKLIRSWSRHGRQCAIVSNNSVIAINRYIANHQIEPEIALVAARTSAKIEQLKPSTFMLEEAISTLNLKKHACIFVGDSVNDLQAGKSAGIRTIAYANKSSKIEIMQGHRPSAILTTLKSLALE